MKITINKAIPNDGLSWSFFVSMSKPPFFFYCSKAPFKKVWFFHLKEKKNLRILET
jgi:hypothetical protein